MKDKKLFGKILIILLLYLAHITIHSLYHCFSKYTLIPVVFSAAYIMQPYPGTPDVTQVEIPFTVTYEINGKQETCNERAKSRKLATVRAFYKYFFNKNALPANTPHCVELNLQ